MRALVTGGTGFLGRHLCNALHVRNHFVAALSRDTAPGGVNWRASAIAHGGYEQVERAIAEYEVDTVFHLAAQTQVSTAVADAVGTWEANVAGTWRVLEACRRQKVKRVLVASSDKAYGAAEVPYRESQALRPHGVYATSKACADMIAQTYALEFGMSVAIVRCGNLYGPGHVNWSTLIPGTIRSYLRGERPRLRSDGGPRRDFVYVNDVVRAYRRLAESDVCGPVNLGTGVGSTVREVVDMIRAVVRSDLEPVIENTAPATEIADQVLDASEAAKIIGWQPRLLIEGLEKTVVWYRENEWTWR